MATSTSQLEQLGAAIPTPTLTTPSTDTGISSLAPGTFLAPSFLNVVNSSVRDSRYSVTTPSIPDPTVQNTTVPPLTRTPVRVSPQIQLGPETAFSLGLGRAPIPWNSSCSLQMCPWPDSKLTLC
jgi:hypothetical protein